MMLEFDLSRLGVDLAGAGQCPRRILNFIFNKQTNPSRSKKKKTPHLHDLTFRQWLLPPEAGFLPCPEILPTDFQTEQSEFKYVTQCSPLEA